MEGRCLLSGVEAKGADGHDQESGRGHQADRQRAAAGVSGGVAERQAGQVAAAGSHGRPGRARRQTNPRPSQQRPQGDCPRHNIASLAQPGQERSGFCAQLAAIKAAACGIIPKVWRLFGSFRIMVALGFGMLFNCGAPLGA